MGRWVRIATTVLALTIAGAVVPAAEGAEPPVELRFTSQPKVAFSQGLTSASGTPGASAVAAWRVSRPAQVTAAALDSTGRVVRTLVEDLLVTDLHQVTWTFTDAAGKDVPEGDYTLRVEAVDSDGARDVEDYAMPLDRHTVIPLQGVVSGATYSASATMSIGPKTGVTPTSARFMVGDAYDDRCATSDPKAPGWGGRIQATFNVSDCGNANAFAGAMFDFTDRIGAKQQGYTALVPVRVVDRVAPTAKLDSSSTASQTLHLKRLGSYETTTTRFAVRDASAITSAGYEVRNGFGVLVATGPLAEAGALEADPLTRLFDLRWNGTRNDGTLAPAARYRVTTRFTDAAGYRATGPVVIVDLDATVPGTLAVRRVDGYRWEAVVTPKAGAGVTQVAVSTAAPDAEDPEPQALPYDGATGTYRAVLDLSDRPAGTYPIRALITRGTPPAATTFTTDDLEVVVEPDTAAPVVSPPVNTRIYLGFTQFYVPGTFAFSVSDQSAVRASDFLVTNAAGTVVDHKVADGGEGRTEFTWDGTGPDGARLPGGDYVVRTTFTDALGNATPASVTVRLDDTVPGTFALVASAENKFTFELTPTPGVTVRGAGIALVGSTCCSAAMARDAATGRYRITVDLSGRPAGSYRFASLVMRDTPGAADPYGFFWTDPITVTVSD
ncbi:FlgD immunoglobulin-like domain containing protein [Nocardioides sp. R1-1]|uniref:FlgD immunoglobulin-like domain containing protein n=1 Tax=Nocardioides sp. R1-1 TaxID=3383502 RepID=UPI0038CF3C23